MWDLFKVNSEDTRKTSRRHFDTFIVNLLIDFIYLSGVLIVEVKQVKTG